MRLYLICLITIFSSLSLLAKEHLKERQSSILPTQNKNELETYDINKVNAMSLFSRAFLDARSNHKITKSTEDDLFAVIEQDPMATEAYMILFADWNSKKNINSYLKRLLPIAKKNPKAINLNLIVFSMLVKEKRDSEGITLLENCYDAIVANYPQSLIRQENTFYKVVAILSMYYQKHKKFEKGDMMFSKLNNSSKPIYHVFASLFYIGIAKKSSDEKTFWIFQSQREKYLDKAKDHIEIASKMLNSSFKPASELALATDAYHLLGMDDAAINLLIQNLSYKPTDIKTYILLAKFYERIGNIDASFRTWEKITHLSLKAESRYFYNLIKMALIKKDYTYAEKELKRHLKLNSRDDLARYQLGMTYYDQKNYDKAITEFKKVKTLNHALYMIAMSYKGLHKYKKTLSALKRYSKTLNQSDLNKHFYFFYSLICDKAGDIDEREKCFETLLKRFGNDADVKNFVGYTWADNNINLKKALKLIKGAVADDPRIAHLDSLVWVLYKQKKYTEAIAVIKSIEDKKLDIYDALIYDHFGDVYNAVGNKTKAQYYWNKALKTKSDEADFDAIRKKLSKL